MKTFAIATALTVSLAAPAFANDQLAQSLGVEPGAYTLSQLIELRSATEDGDWTRVNYIKDNAGADMASVSTKGSSSNAGTAQLEASLGVEPGTLTTAQLIDLKSALADDDIAHANAIRNEASAPGMTASSMSSSVSSGDAQLAASLGVEPGQFSRAQLIELKSAMEDDDWFRVNAIKDEARSQF